MGIGTCYMYGDESQPGWIWGSNAVRVVVVVGWDSDDGWVVV